jgi:hypothetical protein
MFFSSDLNFLGPFMTKKYALKAEILALGFDTPHTQNFDVRNP